MKGIKKFLSYFNIRDFRRYLFLSILVIVTLVCIRSLNFTEARYESTVNANVSPDLAFFVVDVASSTGQIQLTGMVPRSQPYLYTFNVSNFVGNRRANVDLTYSIEIITTTNMPLNFRVFKGSTMQNNEVDSDTIVTDDNGVFYRHLVINDVSVMNYTANCTDSYILWVEYPATYMDYPDEYAGIIDLVDIKINAEQVV